ncbi:hypothetical protein ACFLXA_01675 [Chloroflexota bacterium]
MTLAELFNMSEEDAKKFDPVAIKNYREFIAGISNAVPLDTLTEDDVKKFLSGTSLWFYESSIKELAEWLDKCLLSNGETSLNIYRDSFPIFGTYGLKSSLIKVYNAKQAEKRAEELKKKEQLRAEDLKRQERQRAAEAKKQEEIQTMLDKAVYKMADKEHQGFITTMNKTVENFKLNLSVVKEPALIYPKWLDCYQVNQWCEIPLPDKKQVNDWATPLVFKKVPDTIHQYVTLDISFKTQFVPYIQYEVQGIPCLNWWFKTVMVVRADVNIKDNTFTKKFYGHPFTMKFDSAFLGQIYVGPCFWENNFGMAIPLVLLLMLAHRDLESDGIQVTIRESPLTTFEIKGFEDDVTIHDDFVRFIREITTKQPLLRALSSKQLIDSQTYHLLKMKIADFTGEGEKVKGAGKARIVEQVVKKLISLGWTEKDAVEAVKKKTIPPEASVEAIVKSLLEGELG